MDYLHVLLSNFRLFDLLDIVLVWLIVYRVLTMIKGTRAVQMLTGLAVIAIAFLLSETFQLYVLNSILREFFDHLFLIVVILFQEDIRRGLIQVGRNPFFAAVSSIEEVQVIDEIVHASVQMASKHIGALIVIERETGLRDFVEMGPIIDAKVTQSMLVSLFNPKAPLHDGAVLVQKGRIYSASCLLPLTRNPNVDPALGTRHRAALGLTEETDAVVVVVSEQRGEVSLVKEGRITRDLDAKTLRSVLLRLFELDENLEVPTERPT